jgi:hypothetical protein
LVDLAKGIPHGGAIAATPSGDVPIASDFAEGAAELAARVVIEEEVAMVVEETACDWSTGGALPTANAEDELSCDIEVL